MTWSATCVITNYTGAGRFAIPDTKLYVPVVTLSTQDNTKLPQQLKSGFNRINWNKYKSNSKTYGQNRHLNYLVDPSLQRVKGLVILSFENKDDWTSHWNYHFPKVTIKDYTMIDGKIFLMNQ